MQNDANRKTDFLMFVILKALKVGIYKILTTAESDNNAKKLMSGWV
jgi:hypothetical protein